MKQRTSFAGDFPRCTDLATYMRWRRAIWDNKVPPEKELGAGFCEDCTPEFKAERMAQGRCENPRVRFVVWEGFVSGCALTTEEIEARGLKEVQ